ncbi:MAG: hypothetical protein SGCHY_002147, partial [Lobulomycetales sp.]
MACSRFEYVKRFELLDPPLLPDTFLLIRLDGHAFSSLTADWRKPVDPRGSRLMTAAALHVVKAFPDIRIAYGHSDEFSFVLHPSCSLYSRRGMKITSLITSMFTAVFNRRFSDFFPDSGHPIAVFDGRCVVYPSVKHVRDYLSWRQADCHINNLYNTCFWALVQEDSDSGSVSKAERKRLAKLALDGTDSAQKNELLFSRFGINYSHIEESFRKGSVIYRRVKEPIKASIIDSENGNPTTETPSRLEGVDPTTETPSRLEGAEKIISAKPSESAQNALSTSSKSQSRRSRRTELTVQHCDII